MNPLSDYDSYLEAFDALHQSPVFGLNEADKQSRFFPVIKTLHNLHVGKCSHYREIAENFSPEEMPYVAVRLFKLMKLTSIEPEDCFRVLQSSGTTGQAVAQITLDKATSQRQSKVLVNILQQVIGKQRLPMLIIDAPSTLAKGSAFNARAAGIQGLAFFGRQHTYALNDDMTPNWQAIDQFVAQHQGQPILIFGFTFMLWAYFVRALEGARRTLPLNNAIVLHSGGWKKLEAEKVSNKEFKERLGQVIGDCKIHNFYGMAEQVGSIFVECEQGHLHVPSYADVIVRNPFTLAPSAQGEKGLIQVMSTIPSSYPGHSILTEDLGTQLGVDDCGCGWKGKYFSVSGRLPKVEIRGCSDTHAAGLLS